MGIVQLSPPPHIPVTMAPMKAMKAAMAMKASGMKSSKPGASMTKGAIAEALSEKVEGLKKSECSKLLNALAEVGAAGLKGGKFTLPGLCMIKLRKKPATKACKREVFGEMRVIKARPARTVVKAFAVSALKKMF